MKLAVFIDTELHAKARKKPVYSGGIGYQRIHYFSVNF